jgi:segregation and condensation protein B
MFGRTSFPFADRKSMLRPRLQPCNGASRGWGTGAPNGVRRPYSLLFGVSEGGPVCDPPDLASAAAMDDEDPTRRRMRLEAVLLVAKTPLTTRKLAQLAHLADGTEARTLVRRLNQIYDDLGRSVRIEHVAGGFRMLTRAAYAPWLARLGHLPSAVRLSSPMMETLAVVAYRGPVSRADIEAIRGVACGELLRQLMERDLIRISGRSEELGRPYLYDTTKYFLQLIGLPSGDALPPINWEPLREDDEQNSDIEQIDPEHSS